MAESWPGTLPDYFSTDGFSREGRGNTIFTETLDGRLKARRVSTKTHEPVRATMVMSLAQWDTFIDFYDTTLEAGTKTFQDLNNPLNGNVNTVWQFFEEPTAQPWQGAGTHFLVALALVALPDTPA